MAHGAPDWVQMTDVNLLDYSDRKCREDAHLIVAGDTWTPIDVYDVGTMGLLYFTADTDLMYMFIMIDEREVFREYLQEFFSYHKATGRAMSDYCGVSCYDIVNDLYGIWVDYHYQMSFKKHLQVGIKNTDPLNKNIIRIRAFWKVRV